MKEAVRYAYEHYGLTKGPADKNNIRDMKIIQEEIRKLRDIKNATGFLYFLMEYCTMKHPTKGKVRLAEDIYKWQVDAAVDFLRYKFIISKKTRQTGFSSLTGAYVLWRTLFFPSQNCSILSLSLRESTTFLRERYKFVYSNLPEWLQQKTGEFAKTSVTFDHNGSRFTSLPQGEDPARGDSLSMLVMDEFAAYRHASGILASAVPALSAGLVQPFTDDNLPAQLFLISTLPQHPYDKDGEENKYLEILHAAQAGENDYKIIDVATDDIPHYQDPEWHKNLKSTLGPRRYAIEVLGQEIYDTENMILPGYLFEFIKPSSPIRCDFLHPENVDEEGYAANMDMVPFMKDDFDEEYSYLKGLWIWEEPKPGVEYAAIVDVSTGRAGDYSTVLIFDMWNNVQVAEYRGRVDTERFKRIITMLYEKYNMAKLSIESTGLGGPLAEYFATGICYENFYWHRKSKKDYKPGFPMSASTKAQGVSLMQSYLAKDLPAGAITINSQRLLNEMKSFGYTKGGKIQALAGHDDLVMAFVQYIFLKHIGWANSDAEYMGELPDDDENEKLPEKLEAVVDANRRVVKKYWDQTGMDVNDGEVDMMTQMIRDMGCGFDVG